MKKQDIKPITINPTDIFEFLYQIKVELLNARMNMEKFEYDQMNKTIDKFTEKVIKINNDDRFLRSKSEQHYMANGILNIVRKKRQQKRISK